MSSAFGGLEVRSQLAANAFLTWLAQSIPSNRSFTYVEVANAFHLPAKYVSKMLSRLAKRRLLRAHRITRFDRFGVHRGFLNVYSLSERGLQKARHLLGSSIPEGSAGGEGSILLGVSRAQVEEYFAYPYLGTGKGTIEEFVALGIPIEAFLGCAPLAKAQKANVGAIMIGLDGRFLSAEALSILFRHNPSVRNLELISRLVGLHKLRLTPSDVNPLIYAIGAKYLGRTDDEITIALLARRCLELNKTADTLKTVLEKTSKTEKPDQPHEATVTKPPNQQATIEDTIIEKINYANFLHEMFLDLTTIESDIEEHELVDTLQGLFPMTVNNRVNRPYSYLNAYGRMLRNRVKHKIKNIEFSIVEKEISILSSTPGHETR
jgi:hypothetical protein